jgi:glycosyltransferase involved in cell wall biosynthesis
LEDDAVTEVIVVDGASTDGTGLAAKKAGAKVVYYCVPPEKGGGRGGQIRVGIETAKADVVAVVHADTIVPAPTFTTMLSILKNQPGIVGGAVGGAFDRHDWRLGLIRLANDFRMVFLGISFGDQVQFFRRRPVVKEKLFPALPLMEDVEFSLRLYRMGRQVFLFGDALVSARRWQSAGFGNAVSVVLRMTDYLWKRLWGEPDTLAMYQKYYHGAEFHHKG